MYPLPNFNRVFRYAPEKIGARFVLLSWIEALVAINEHIIACERRFHRQCILVADCAANGQVPAEDEMLLASYMISLTLLRTQRNAILADAPTDS